MYLSIIFQSKKANLCWCQWDNFCWCLHKASLSSVHAFLIQSPFHYFVTKNAKFYVRLSNDMLLIHVWFGIRERHWKMFGLILELKIEKLCDVYTLRKFDVVRPIDELLVIDTTYNLFVSRICYFCSFEFWYDTL